MFLIPRWSSGYPPFFAVSTVLHVIISKQDIHICYIFHIYSTTTLSSVLKPKYSLSIKNKCVYLLESFETSTFMYYNLASRIPPKLLNLGCAMEKTARWNFLKLWQIMYLNIIIGWKLINMNFFNPIFNTRVRQHFTF